MNSIELLAPILGGGIRSVNFFNGRLLSGEDMSKEQAANREGRRLLGQAAGEGIAYGLEVAKAAGAGTKPILTIEPGLAVSRRGDALRLTSPVDLSLVRPQNDGASGVAALTFKECLPFQSGVYVTGAGVYLLTMTPALGSEGRALVSGLTNATADCNTKYLVDGVQFRLIQLDLTPAELNDQDRLRNLVAYKCFGIADIKSFISNPFGPPLARYGLLDALRPNRLTDGDVPLAVLHWTTDGIKFVDMWSVRRRIIDPAVTDRWNVSTGDRYTAESEAMLLQFQDQVEAMRITMASLESVVATSSFHYLPPVGIIPLAGIKSSRGFDYLRFFSGLTHRNPVFTEGAKVEPLIRHALAYLPIDPSSKELIWLYFVRENMQAINTSVSNPPQSYMIFASGHTLYQGDARYDLARWSYSNYSLAMG